MRIIIPLCLLFISTIHCWGQNAFSLGAKILYGTSAFPMDVTIESGSLNTMAKSGSILAHGIIGRYMINDKFGIESGFTLNHYSFYTKDKFNSADAFWKTGAEFEIADLQVPIILNYKMSFLRHPFRYVIIGAGTSLDWFIPFAHEGIAFPIPPGAFQNCVGLIKLGRETPKGHKFEVGIEMQYSLTQFQIAHFANDGLEHHVYSRTNMVGVNLSYFFLKRERVNEAM